MSNEREPVSFWTLRTRWSVQLAAASMQYQISVLIISSTSYSSGRATAALASANPSGIIPRRFKTAPYSSQAFRTAYIKVFSARSTSFISSRLLLSHAKEINDPRHQISKDLMALLVAAPGVFDGSSVVIVPMAEVIGRPAFAEDVALVLHLHADWELFSLEADECFPVPSAMIIGEDEVVLPAKGATSELRTIVWDFSKDSLFGICG